MDLADASERLLAQAAARNPAGRVLHVDLCAFETPTPYQAVMCRGVLNDMITDAERDAVLRAFARALTADGVLLLDVREAEGSRERADGEPRQRTVELGAQGVLQFTNTATWRDGLVHVVEEYRLERATDSGLDHTVYEFRMRPWSVGELRDRLGAAGFGGVRIEPGVGRRTADRLFVTAERG